MHTPLYPNVCMFKERKLFLNLTVIVHQFGMVRNASIILEDLFSCMKFCSCTSAGVQSQMMKSQDNGLFLLHSKRTQVK